MGFGARLRSTAGYPVAQLEPEGGDVSNRFAAYVEGKLIPLNGGGGTVSRLILDRTIVKCAVRLHREMAMTPREGERLKMMLDFLDALDVIELLRLDVEPPDLVETIVERVATPSPAPLNPTQVMGLLFDEEGGG